MANRLIMQMALHDREALEPRLATVDLARHQRIAAKGNTFEALYFIDSGLASVVAKRSSVDVEVLMLGEEGLAGTEYLLDCDVCSNDIVVQVAGKARMIDAGYVRRAMDESPSLRQILMRYVSREIEQRDQSSLAAATSTIPQRLARWLLMAQDRLGNAVDLTHERLADLLAIRRAGVTTTLNDFAAAGAVKLSRRSIRIVQRHLLLDIAGRAYQAPTKPEQGSGRALSATRHECRPG